MAERIIKFLTGELEGLAIADGFEKELVKLETSKRKPREKQLLEICRLELTRLREALLNPDVKTRERAITHLGHSLHDHITALRVSK